MNNSLSLKATFIQTDIVDNHIYSQCLNKEETASHILHNYDGLAGFTHHNLGKHFMISSD